MRFSVEQAEKFIRQEHSRYYERLQEFCKTFGVPCRLELPRIEIVDSVYTHCGQYSPIQNLCIYSNPFCIYAGEDYAETVAHEVCHAFQLVIKPACSAHGKTFLWLLRDVCGFPNAGAYHSYPVAEVERLAQALKGGREVNDAMPIRGRSSLSSLVEMYTKQRKAEHGNG